MKKLFFESVMIVSVLDKANKDGKVYPKLVTCDDYGNADKVGIPSELIPRLRQSIGTKISFVAKVWENKSKDGNGIYTSYEIEPDSIVAAKPALKSAA